MLDTWGVISSLSAAAAAGVAGWGLIQNSRAIQLQVLENVFRDIRDLERIYYESYADKSDAEKQHWDALFFNTLEYLAFLINRRIVRRGRLLDFYRDALPTWRGMFERLASDEVKRLPYKYPEFKKLCRKLSRRTAEKE